MKCPRCGNQYHSKYDICYSCYLELKEQYTQEAIKYNEQYFNENPNTWSSCYRLAFDEAERYNENKKITSKLILPYFIEKYVYYKILEYVKPIHEQNRKLLKIYLQKLQSLNKEEIK